MFTASPSRVPSIEAPSYGDDDDEITVEEAQMVSPGAKVIELFSCSTQLSMKFTMFINVKMPTIY